MEQILRAVAVLPHGGVAYCLTWGNTPPTDKVGLKRLKMTANNLKEGETYLVFYRGEWRTAEYSGWASGQLAHHFSCHDGNNAYITRNELPHQVRADYETAKR